MRNTYFFQQSKAFIHERFDSETALRPVRAINESSARGRLPKPGPGRVWKLVKVNRPSTSIERDIEIVPVILDGDEEAVVGFGEVRSDGAITVTLNQIRLMASDLPDKKSRKTVRAISVGVAYQGVVTHKRKA